MDFLIGIGVVLAVLIIGGLIALPLILYNATTIRKTKRILAGYGQKQQIIGFVESIKRLFLRAFDYRSRASLSEFWFITLGEIILGLIVFFCFAPMVQKPAKSLAELGVMLAPYAKASTVVGIILFLPNLALWVRRMHDTGISVTKYFVTVCVGFFIALVLGTISLFALREYQILFFLIAILFTLYPWCLIIKVRWRASLPHKNRFGEVPNLEKVGSKRPTSKRKK